MKKLFGVAALLVAGFVGYEAYKMQQGGYFDMPEVGVDDFSLSFKSGLRGIMRDMVDERPQRRYLAYNAKDVPTWFQKVWSECRPPEENERASFEHYVDVGPGGRLEALCEIDADGDVFVRGWFVSVPNL
ncbi:hypothetical protein A8B82_10800 [Sulfitobacter sp. EhC04]|uniref:hypothetical protein n=1 Tax=Sulfitobacter sp. EhC04 TaxID=1849168 RepID=UPI0007F3E080|nr:hypothetical protein [Sulfitobacter sp. EhC04]OAN78221.1 hypothetical protein A8B82_10800 [Sulfitobacter sp. EhC04]